MNILKWFVCVIKHIFSVKKKHGLICLSMKEDEIREYEKSISFREKKD